ncbi:MAG: AAA family ATPase [bacterium]|nr:AAA family ATPase [bacterium]
MSDHNNTGEVKKIPYGISNYKRIREENFYYVDKTPYLPTVKEFGTYLFFIRPRRFGKSLFLSMMEAYYDIFYKERFEEFFKGTWIYDNPTPDRGSFLVLKFNFSMVNPGIDFFEGSFLEYVRGTARSFINKYSQYFKTKERDHSIDAVQEAGAASDILNILVHLCTDLQQGLYVIIDEYDNFANTILSTSGKNAYEKLTRGAGSFRAFFNVLKGGTEGPFSRLFLTGVSPVTLDDVTSGYNIGKNISIDSDFNRMLGFTGEDVVKMIGYYRSKGMIQHGNDYLLEIMTQWYGNYRFSEDDNVKMFNSDMVLYFLEDYIRRKKVPKNLIDRNVRIDYGKLRHLIIIDKGKGGITSNGNFNRLKDIIEKGRISAELQEGFPLENITEEYNFISLLFYFGLLTINSSEVNRSILTIPNETIRRLFYDYIKKGYDETDVFTLNLAKYGGFMSAMALRGEWKPLFDYISGRMTQSMSLRDLITGEKSIQAFLNVYLGLSDLYIIHPEKEMNKGYADILMEPFLARYEGISYSYLLEIKYVKSGAKVEDDDVKQLILGAEEQLKNYSADDKFRKNIEKTTLIKLVLVFSGHEMIYIDLA